MEEGSLTLLVAIFFSNLPEYLVGAVAMCEGGRPPRFAIALWTACAVLLTLAVILGRVTRRGLTRTSSPCAWPSRVAPSWPRSPTP